MEENSAQQQNYNDIKYNLPNATAVLVLGIISIVGCFCYGVVGIICGIIALVLASKDMRSYKTDPSRYTAPSYSNLRAGRVCAIIGLIFSALYLLFLIAIISTIGLEALKHPQTWMHQ